MKNKGGTWKIAYADFVTAMMILFLTLWISSIQSKKKLEAIESYFKNPLSTKYHTLKTYPTVDPNNQLSILDQDLKNSYTTQKLLINTKQRQALNVFLHYLRKYNIDKEYPDNISVRWNKGIIMEVTDSYNRPFFKDLTSEIMPYAADLLSKIVSLLKTQNSYITIDGHATLVQGSNLDPWLLSFERANKIKQYIEKKLPNIVIKVSSNSDKSLLDVKNRSNPINTRITIKLISPEELNNQHLTMPLNVDLNPY